MNGADVIVGLLLLTVIGGAALYIRKAKKRGQRCIGCPHSKRCSGCCPGCEQ